MTVDDKPELNDFHTQCLEYCKLINSGYTYERLQLITGKEETILMSMVATGRHHAEAAFLVHNMKKQAEEAAKERERLAIEEAKVRDREAFHEALDAVKEAYPHLWEDYKDGLKGADDWE